MTLNAWLFCHASVGLGGNVCIDNCIHRLLKLVPGLKIFHFLLSFYNSLCEFVHSMTKFMQYYFCPFSYRVLIILQYVTLKHSIQSVLRYCSVIVMLMFGFDPCLY